MNKPKHIIWAASGLVAAFDFNGQQIPELQKSPFLTYCEFLESKGIDPTEVTFTSSTGSGMEVFRTEDGGFNYRLK